MPPERTQEQRETFQKWLEALRSDKYTQGFGYLCYEGRYCCLGVLADVAQIGKIWPKGTKDRPNPPVVFNFPVGGQSQTIMPEAAYSHITGRHSCEAGILASLNDIRGLSFREIADLLERAEAENTILQSNAQLP